MRPKNVVAYLRVSTGRQVEEGASLDNQEGACGDWVFRQGARLMKQFREEGVSAKTLNRPQFQEMIKYIKEHASEIDIVLVYQIDRLSRSVPDFVDVVRLLNSLGIELRDCSSQLEAGESDELIQTIQAALAQHDNRLKSKRVIENMKRQAAEGHRMHVAPIGLRNVRDALNKPTLEAVQPDADKIAYLLTEFAKVFIQKQNYYARQGILNLHRRMERK